MNELTEQAREMARNHTVGFLALNLHDPEGFPFGALTPYGLDAEFRPIFLMSDLSTHAQNLQRDPRASLFLTNFVPGHDPMEAGRLNLIGKVAQVEESEEIRRLYLSAYPAAEQWIDFGDFRFYRLEIERIYFVAGFGSMGFVDLAEFRGV